MDCTEVSQIKVKGTVKSFKVPYPSGGHIPFKVVIQKNKFTLYVDEDGSSPLYKCNKTFKTLTEAKLAAEIITLKTAIAERL